MTEARLATGTEDLEVLILVLKIDVFQHWIIGFCCVFENQQVWLFGQCPSGCCRFTPNVSCGLSGLAVDDCSKSCDITRPQCCTILPCTSGGCQALRHVLRKRH